MGHDVALPDGANPSERLVPRHHGHFPRTDLVTSATGESEPGSLIDKARFETGHQPLDQLRPVFDRQLQSLCSEIFCSGGHGWPRSTRRQRITGFAAAGVSKNGTLQRLLTGRGLYSLPGQAITEHHSLAEVAIRVPRGVVCLLSALRVHGIGTQAPHEVWLAIPHRAPVPRFAQPAIRVVRMSGASLVEGIDRHRIDGVDGWSQRKVTMDDLWRYAAIGRVANVMRPYLESVAAALRTAPSGT